MLRKLAFIFATASSDDNLRNIEIGSHMNRKVWEEETFELLLNNGRFQITDSGPLCSPIKSFEIKRDNKQRLLLTTRCDEKSINGSLNSPQLPAGMVHS